MAGFDFGKFTDQLESQRALTAERQAIQRRTEQTQAEIMNRSAKAAAEYQTVAEPVRKELLNRRAKGQHARQLADSGSVLDVLRLMGLQSQDPAGYKRSVRTARTAEDTQFLSAYGQTYNVTQEALRVEMLASSNELNRAKIEESIGLERLKQIQEEAALLRDNLAAAQTFQAGAIHNMTPEELEAAAAGAKANGGAVNISGIDVQQTIIEDRLEALRERSFLLEQREYERELERARMGHKETELGAIDAEAKRKQDSNENIDHELSYNAYQRGLQREEMRHAGTERDIRSADRRDRLDQARRVDHTIAVRDYNEKLQKDEIENLPDTLQQREFERTIRKEDRRREYDRRILATYSAAELSRLEMNGYQDAVGNKFHHADVRAAMETRQAAEADAVNTIMTNHALNNFDRDMVVREAQRIERVEGRFREGSALAVAARAYKSALGTVARDAESDNPLHKIAAMAMQEQARESFNKAIVAQAKAEAPNDEAKQQMLVAFYSGEPIPMEVLRSSLQERIVKNRSTADILPSDISLSIQRRYRDLLQSKLQAQTEGGMLGSVSASDRKILEAEAAQEAIEWGVNNNLQGRTEQILSNQVLHPQHPLHGKTPMEMAGMLRVADQEAIMDWQADHQLAADEVAAILSGQPVPNRDTGSLVADLKHRQNVMFFQQLNSIDPDMGQRVARWWQRHGDQYLIREQASHTAGAMNDFNQAAFRTIGEAQESRSMYEYASGLVSSEESMMQEATQRRAEFLTFGGSPENAQVMFLEHDENLEDHEKQALWAGFIAPIISEVNKMGLPYAEANRAIEEAIYRAEPKDPEMKRLVKTMKRDRAKHVARMGKLLGHASMFNKAERIRKQLGVPESKHGTWPFPKPIDTNPYSAGITWYTDWKAKQPAPPTSGR